MNSLRTDNGRFDAEMGRMKEAYLQLEAQVRRYRDQLATLTGQ